MDNLIIKDVLLPILSIPLISTAVFSLSIKKRGDVVAGRPLTLECKITRTESNTCHLAWNRYVGQSTVRLYSSSQCTSSIQLSQTSPAGLSGGCQHVNGEEVYKVTIQNVTEDMGTNVWRCTFGNQADNITLDVKVMVSRVTLKNFPNSVLANNPSTFTCVTSPSKPRACVRAYIWSSGNVSELDPGDCNQDSSSVQTTNRTLRFTASAENNGAKLYCNASNSVTDPPLRSQVYTLSVQYPPQNGVLLSGYVNNTAVESGQTLTLTCQVGEGNPQPKLTWSSGCGQTNTVPGNDGSQQISISITVSPSLNQKTCVCSGSQDGAATRWTEQKSRTLNVTFGPDSVQLWADSGQSGNIVSVRENSTVTFTCNTSESNPAAVLSWYNNSSPIAPGEVSALNQTAGYNHGYLSTQQYAFRVDRYHHDDVIRCEGHGPGIGNMKRLSSNLVLDVKYPPQSGVRLSGHVNNTAVESGETLTLACQVGKGNPQPKLTWSSGCGQTNTVPGNDGSQQISISITVSPFLNQRTCVCNGSQDEVLTKYTDEKSVTFSVLFGPNSVQLRADSGQSGNTVTITQNSTVTFTCTSGESNPAAVLSWYNNSGQIAPAEISGVSSKRGPNHGYLTTHRYTVSYDQYQDGDVIRCEAERPGNGGSKRVSPYITIVKQLSVNNPSALAAPLAGGLSGAVVLLGLILLVVVVIRRRKTGGRSPGETEKTRPGDVPIDLNSTRHYENLPEFTGSGISALEDENSSSVSRALDAGNVDQMHSSSASDSGVPAGLYSVVDKKKGPPVYAKVNKPQKAPKAAKSTGFSVTRHVTPTFAGRSVGYEDVDPIPNSPATGSDVPPGLNTVADKTKDAQLAPPVYAQVNKPQKAPKPAKVPEGPTYAEVNKTGKKGTTKTGRTTTDTFTNAAFAGDEVTHYNTGEDGRVKQSRRFGQKKGPRELVYVETEFADTKSTTLRTKSKTSYVSIAFDEKRPPI